jgi:hypothetical protein
MSSNKPTIKDFMGNELKVGDFIVITNKTYSKTPLLKYGKIKNIQNEYKDNGEWKESVIYFNILGVSDQYLSQLEDNNYTQEYDGTEIGKYYLNRSKYITILKVG